MDTHNIASSWPSGSHANSETLRGQITNTPEISGVSAATHMDTPENSGVFGRGAKNAFGFLG